MRNLFVMILLVSLSLPLLFAIEPATETIFAESLVPGSKSTLHNLKVDQLSSHRLDPIPISNPIASNNSCSTGWYTEGYFLPIESDYDGKGYMQTITIHRLNDLDNTTTRTLNSEFLENVRIEGGGLTKQGDYIGSWDDKFWGPISFSIPIFGYPLVVGITSQTDRSLIPYGEIFTIPTLSSPWNTTTFMALDRGSNIEGKQINIYTGVGSSAEKEKVKVTGTQNIVCAHKQASTQECNTDVLPTYTQAICRPDSTITTTNISIGDPVFDQFDSYIINATNHHGITDSMMVKSMILQESSFDMFAISPDIPCEVPDGWTDQESRSFGLMQVTPACIEDDGSRPDLTRDMNSPNWTTSWFNPEYNINRGV
jgi:hypothetical protein